jgi:hypothetical protein
MFSEVVATPAEAEEGEDIRPKEGGIGPWQTLPRGPPAAPAADPDQQTVGQYDTEFGAHEEGICDALLSLVCDEQRRVVGASEERRFLSKDHQIRFV